MGVTKIEWTGTFDAAGNQVAEGYTFNPWWGCTETSSACDHCYARGFAVRLGKGALWRGEREVAGEKRWSSLQHWNRKAQEAGAPRKVFVGSMMDIGDPLPQLDAPRTRFFDLVRSFPWLTFLLLTKRPQVLLGKVPREWLGLPDPALKPGEVGPGSRAWWEPSDLWPRNVWVGSTIESARDLWRLRYLLQFPAPVRFVSNEPALGAFDLRRVPRAAFGALHGIEGDFIDVLGGGMWRDGAYTNRSNMPRIGWVITGDESGPGRRPPPGDEPEAWARAMRDQCEARDVPWFYKQRQNPAGAHLVDHLPELDGRRHYAVPPAFAPVPW